MHEIIALLQHYGLLLVFVTVLIDVIGLPLPSYPVLLVAGALAINNQALALLIGVAAAAALAGDLLLYAVSARVGRRILSLMCRITLSADSCVQRTEASFESLGVWTLPIGKFVPGLGFASIALSAITRMNVARFITFDAIGALAYVSLPIFSGNLFKGAVDAVLATLLQLGGFGMLLLLAVFGLYIAARWLERLAFTHKLRMARIAVAELAGLMERGHAPVIFDVRNEAARVEGGMIPGAVAAHTSDLVSLTANYARDTEIVIYCDCPNEASAAVAALHLKHAGFSNIRPLLGGVEAWSNAGLPLAKIANASDDMAAASPDLQIENNNARACAA